MNQGNLASWDFPGISLLGPIMLNIRIKAFNFSFFFRGVSLSIDDSKEEGIPVTLETGSIPTISIRTGFI